MAQTAMGLLLDSTSPLCTWVQSDAPQGSNQCLRAATGRPPQEGGRALRTSPAQAWLTPFARGRREVGGRRAFLVQTKKGTTGGPPLCRPRRAPQAWTLHGSHGQNPWWPLGSSPRRWAYLFLASLKKSRM